MFHVPVAALSSVIALAQPTPGGPERKTCKAADGVPIVCRLEAAEAIRVA